MRETENIRIIPLGGLGEIGKNMMLIEYQDSIIIVDSGMMFPEDQMPGIDFVIPDFSYIAERRNKVKALLLTHGHEDHIGALPYLLKEINVPVYGTRLTIGFARNRLEEHTFTDRPVFIEIRPREKISFGAISAEFFRVCHSVADGVGIAFHTPHGIIIHSGDFKIDFTPVYDDTFDFRKLSEFGEKGVILLMSDSTNAENKGYTPSESKLNDSLFETITGSDGKVLVALFASNIQRIQQIFDICFRAEKKVAVLGMSMEKNIAMAKDLGYLKFKESILISPEKVNSYKSNRVVVLTTGSQGEPMSALSRIAASKYKSFDIEKGDTVILSASIIPGNEKTVSRIVNILFRKGASVLYEGFEDLHVSGHAFQEELKLFIAITKPKYFIPIHGEFRHLIHHSNLAKQVGVEEKNIIIAEDGDVININESGIAIVDKVAAGHVYIDGKSIGDVESTILRERHKISEDGIIIVIIPIGVEDSSILHPEIISRGFVYSIEAEIFTEAKDIVFDMVRKHIRDKTNDRLVLKNRVKKALKNYFFKKTAQSPLIVPVIIEVP